MVNSLPNDKILDRSKLKAFADDKIKVLKMLIFVFEWVENIAGEKEKMLVTSIFSFSLNVSKNAFHSGSLKVWIVW